ncbi:MAG: HD domain-containing phosphohydrolase [Bacillota bacterium]|nr:HD domain-containing phosphohydrolase [Bacillota bacterium]
MNITMNEIILITILVITLVICSIYILIIKKKNRDHQLKLGTLTSLIDEFRPSLGLEKNLDLILLKVQEIVQAPNYSFYIINPANGQYTLKAVRQLSSGAKIAPSYSGLLPYDKEKFNPPLSLLSSSFPSAISIVKEGEVPLLTVPIKGKKGFIRIGPLRTSQNNMNIRLGQLGELLEVPLMNLLEEEDNRRNYQVLELSSRAVKFINSLYIHEIEYLKLLVQTSFKTLQPQSCLFFQVGRDYQHVLYSSGYSDQTLSKLKRNLNLAKLLRENLGSHPLTMIAEKNLNFTKIKGHIDMKGMHYFIAGQFSLLEKHYLLLFSFEKGTPESERIRKQLIKTLWVQIQHFIKMKHESKHVSISYIDLLKSLADMIDQMSPYTFGYSKLISKYCMAIAKEMGLSEIQVRSIGLAAYFSNIGVIGLSDGLLNKEGKYSEEEFEEMKLHSEVGSAIIENTIAQDEIALYIKHHHERMDGNGYPSRLKGDNIPVGARIIAVVQTFLAKINGRSYRTPLSIEDAFNLLKNGGGSQLDAQVVETFIKWYKHKKDKVSLKQG